MPRQNEINAGKLGARLYQTRTTNFEIMYDLPILQFQFCAERANKTLSSN